MRSVAIGLSVVAVACGARAAGPASPTEAQVTDRLGFLEGCFFHFHIDAGMGMCWSRDRDGWTGRMWSVGAMSSKHDITLRIEEREGTLALTMPRWGDEVGPLTASPVSELSESSVVFDSYQDLVGLAHDPATDELLVRLGSLAFPRRLQRWMDSRSPRAKIQAAIDGTIDAPRIGELPGDRERYGERATRTSEP